MRRVLSILTIFVLFTLLVVPQFALGDDLGDLKAANAKFNQALMSLDAETVASMVYPGMVLYGRNAAFPTVLPMENTQAQVTQTLKEWFSNLEYFRLIPYNMQYRVIGNTGLVWGHQTGNIKAKGESPQTGYSRVTTAWIKSNGKWYIVMDHASAIPSGR